METGDRGLNAGTNGKIFNREAVYLVFSLVWNVRPNSLQTARNRRIYQNTIHTIRKSLNHL